MMFRALRIRGLRTWCWEVRARSGLIFIKYQVIIRKFGGSERMQTHSEMYDISLAPYEHFLVGNVRNGNETWPLSLTGAMVEKPFVMSHHASR